jgi:hypothetical protein
MGILGWQKKYLTRSKSTKWIYWRTRCICIVRPLQSENSCSNYSLSRLMDKARVSHSRWSTVKQLFSVKSGRRSAFQSFKICQVEIVATVSNSCFRFGMELVVWRLVTVWWCQVKRVHSYSGWLGIWCVGWSVRIVVNRDRRKSKCYTSPTCSPRLNVCVCAFQISWLWVFIHVQVQCGISTTCMSAPVSNSGPVFVLACN